MSSSAVAYREAQPARTAGDLEPTTQVAPEGDRGKDWPLAVAVFVPVLVAYAGVGYGVYVILRTLL